MRSRRIMAFVIDNDVGESYRTSAEAVDALQGYWGPVFSDAVGICDADTDDFLRHVERSEFDLQPVCLADFSACIAASPDSARGPDGLQNRALSSACVAQRLYVIDSRGVRAALVQRGHHGGHSDRWSYRASCTSFSSQTAGASQLP